MSRNMGRGLSTYLFMVLDETEFRCIHVVFVAFVSNPFLSSSFHRFVAVSVDHFNPSMYLSLIFLKLLTILLQTPQYSIHLTGPLRPLDTGYEKTVAYWRPTGLAN